MKDHWPNHCDLPSITAVGQEWTCPACGRAWVANICSLGSSWRTSWGFTSDEERLVVQATSD